MAGIYIHIPFCKRKCHYCNFFSVASLRQRPYFTDQLIKEIELQKDYLGKEQVKTVYYGGGTPSLLEAKEIDQIFDALSHSFNMAEDAEITLEANPDDVTDTWIDAIKSSHVNRISLGVQSFFDPDLVYLNRIHTAEQSVRAIDRLQDKGINELSIDLIYGIPGLTVERWKENLRQFLSMNIPHLSAYALTVEEGTALDVMIRRKKTAPPEDDEAVKHFKVLQDVLEEAGYIHYEISNFALRGHYSKHNSLYWTGGHYLGLGPSAHSYNGYSRRWNKSSLKAWSSLEEYYSESFEEEILTHDQRFNEYVMTSLRTIWGCDMALVAQEFGQQYHTHLKKQVRPHVRDENLIIDRGRIFLTRKGKLFADGIAADLFM